MLGFQKGHPPHLWGTKPPPMLRRSLLLAALAVAPFAASIAQYNQKGMVHLSLGASVGAHGTELESKYRILGVTLTDTDTDGAATVSFPFQVGYALGNRFSLGLLIEPGRYVPDSANSDQQNAFLNVALEPRFYIVNANRVAWHASMQLGAVALHITDKDPDDVDARYSGGAFGLGTGVAIGLGNTIGLGFDLRYLATSMELKAMEINNASVTDFYSATLRTSGVIAQLSLAFRFGGGK